MSYDLFQNEEIAGFHLEFFQILNWGLFDSQVYTLNAESKSTLLTGVNGSGKTTLVDALTTLLVPNSLRFYNQSSGSTKKKDRSEESYVLGAYGNIQNSASLSNSTQYLRKKDDVISILNGCFYDQKTGRTLSLLQVRYFSGSELQRIFALTENRLSVEGITKSLSEHGTKIDRQGKWKRLLSNMCGTVFYDSFEKYKSAFSEILGFRSDKALKLFSQIVGLKVLGNLTEFIRENMLEKADADLEFQKLEMNYENLLQSERTILKTQKQIELLEPIIQTGKKIDEAEMERERLLNLREAIIPWKTGRNLEILAKKSAELKREIANLEEGKNQKTRESEILEEAIRSLQADIDSSDSARRITQIESEIRNLSDEKNRRKTESERYEEKSSVLSLNLPQNQKEFQKNLDEMENLTEKFAFEKSSLDERKTEIAVSIKETSENLKNVEAELQSLGKRNSNIPEKNIRIRADIANHLKISENELPFAGELLEVKKGEEEWNFSIEHLLHNFALTVLVKEEHYKAVTEYVKNHDLGGRLVYLRTSQNENFILGDTPSFDSETVPGKVEAKKAHELTSWIENYVGENFNYRCTDDIKEISRTQKAITKSGLIKNGLRHEKDDRKEVKAHFTPVLGWDNTQKRKILSNRFDELTKESENLKIQIEKTDEKLAVLFRKTLAVNSLLEINSFEKIDFASVAKEIDSLSDEKEKLSKSKDIQEKFALLEQKKEEKRIIEQDRDKLSSLLAVSSDRLETVTEKLEENQNKWQIYLTHPDFESVIKNSVAALCEEYPRLTKAETEEAVNHGEQNMRQNLDEKISGKSKSIQGFELNLGQFMREIYSPSQRLRQEFGDWSSDFSSFGTTKEFLPDYNDFYNRLKKDDLPKYQKQFHEFLHNSVKDDIINFNQFINNAKEDIENAVSSLNQNLRAITYQQNPDTYLSLKCERAKDSRIDEFNRYLHNSIPDAVRFQMQDSAYEEELFLKIKAFLESLKENQNLRDYVLDIRNWFTFAASENYCQDNVQKQYYSDSASLSGGEKAKLTYTILASAISYQFGITEDSQKSFRFVIIDEAFSKSDSTNSEYAMKLFKQLDLQVMVITPLDKINIVEDYISSVHMTENKNTNDSRLLSMTIQEYQKRKTDV